MAFKSLQEKGQIQIEKNKSAWAASEWRDVENFLGANADKYKPLYDRMRLGMIEKGQVLSFFNTLSICWSAIPFFAVPWCVARKQYLFAGILFVGAIILSLLSAKAGPGATLAVGILLALTIKSNYLTGSIAKIHEIKSKTTPGAEQDAAIRAAGGVNVNHGVVVGVGLLVATLLLALTMRF
jgi:hypothetical protein